jgi:uncharacterized oxidoreductase
MDLASTSVLVTGGATGIGLAIAEYFLRAGSEVAICGRREEHLLTARDTHPTLKLRTCDLTRVSDRVALADWAAGELPRLNVLVNNAGIQRRFELAATHDWERTQEEIAVNFEAPVHLCELLIPHLIRQQRAMIINVTSGLAFAPMAIAPVYCATKAALHSFTLSLRQQLSASSITVVEMVPPAVNTDLGGAGLHTFGVPVTELVNGVMPRIEAGELEVAYGFAEQASRASRAELDEIFRRINRSH